MHETLKNRTYLGKKKIFNILGADFLAPKCSHRREKQPVLGPSSLLKKGKLLSLLNVCEVVKYVYLPLLNLK